MLLKRGVAVLEDAIPAPNAGCKISNGANTDQNRAQHEFDCLTHGNPFGRPSASTSSVPSGAAIIKFVLPDVSPRLHYDRAGYTRSYRGSVGEVEGKGQPDDADHHNQFDDGALL